MKKIISVFLTICVLLSISAFSVNPANIDMIYYTNDGCTEKIGGWTNSDALKGYDTTTTNYGHTRDAAFLWKPILTFGGKYKVYSWNVVHDTNCNIVKAEITHKNGTDVVEYQHKDIDSGWVLLGEYEFAAGPGAVVKFTRASSEGSFIRLNCLRFELVEIGEEGFNISLPQLSNDYEPYHTRSLPTREVKLPEINENATKIYVSPDGNGNGEKDNPASLEGAKTIVRELIRNGKSDAGIGVLLKGGTYELEKSFTLTSEDNGTKDNPIIWQAYDGEVTFTSGKVLDKSLFMLTNDERIPKEGQGKVYALPLDKAGINNVEPIVNIQNSYVLTIGDKLGKMSKWPNEGYAYTGNTTDMASRNDSGPRKKGFTYEVVNPRMFRWDASKGDAWVMGFFLTDYNLMAMKLANINAKNMTFSGKNNTVYGSYNNGRFYALNLLEEIDAPGEWYIDTTTNTLYLYPYDGWENQEIKLATESFDAITFDKVTNVVIKNINIDTIRGSGVKFSSSFDCMFAGGKIINVSSTGVVIHGRNITVRDCDISNTGGKGVTMSGGVARDLVRANNKLENNIVHDVGVSSNEKMGISYSGVGQIIVNNHLYNIPMTGMGGNGLEHTVNYNIIERTCLEDSDTACIYYNNEGPGHGTTMNYNIIREPVGLNHHMAAGIYIDNGTSGVELKGNILINVNWGALNFHCDRENVAINNVLIGCSLPINMMGGKLGGDGANIGGMVYGSIKNNYADQEPYITKYPRFANIYEDEFFYTKYNVVKNNMLYGCGESVLKGTENEGEAINNVHEPEFNGDIYDLKTIDFADIKSKIPEFEEIPLDLIGPYIGGERTSTEDIIFDNRAREFELGYPANGATNVDVNTELRWTTENGGVEQYTVYLSEDEEFSKISSMGYATKASLDINLDYGKTYYWKVLEKPYKGYAERWNNGGAFKFTTISLEDKHKIESQRLIHLAETTGCYEEYKARIEELSSDVSIGGIRNIGLLIDEISNSKTDYSVISTHIYDDFETDVLDARPLNLYMRSSYAVKVNATTDPYDKENQVVNISDTDKASYQAADRYFESQSEYLEAGFRVMPRQYGGSFTASIRQTGSVTYGGGPTSSIGASVVFSEDGMIYADSEKKVSVMPYKANEWYSIKMVYHISEGCYDLYVDGNKVAEEVKISDKNLKEVYMLTFSTTEGVKQALESKGEFMIDDIIVKAPTGYKKNSLLEEIRVDGKLIPDFEPGKFVYDFDGSLDAIEAKAFDREANIKIKKTDDEVIVSIVSADRSSVSAYLIN